MIPAPLDDALIILPNWRAEAKRQWPAFFTGSAFPQLSWEYLVSGESR
jgi:hypothetical protein